ncbi:hypothetical protein K439DRAFT_1264349, partial [Ramaria rubella]
QYPPPALEFHPVTDTQIERAIKRLSPFKAPGPNGIPNSVLIQCSDLIIPFLGPIFRSTFKLTTYPSSWK